MNTQTHKAIWCSQSERQSSRLVFTYVQKYNNGIQHMSIFFKP